MKCYNLIFKILKIERFLLLIILIITVSFIKKKNNISIKSNNEKFSKNIKNDIKLRFEEFTIHFLDSIEIWDEEKELFEIQQDTANVFLEIGETIENQKFEITKHMEGEIKIYQRFENSITIMNEGPHCDLIDWKHFNSKWKELEIIKDKFYTYSYSEKDIEQFINVDINELKDAVRNQCGEGWYDLLKDIKSPTDYPSGVSTSRIFLKIIFNHKLKGIFKENIISFEIPMGC